MKRALFRAKFASCDGKSHLLSLQHRSNCLRYCFVEQPLFLSFPRSQHADKHAGFATYMMERYPLSDEVQTVVIDEADKLLDPLPAHAPASKVRIREKSPRAACRVMDLLVYGRVFATGTEFEDRRYVLQRSRKHNNPSRSILTVTFLLL
eukprot:m.71742 g.71742  ORF g.71742 m.71742 type:complete len:150 (+) comp12314_c0_seq9:553-1002(+)